MSNEPSYRHLAAVIQTNNAGQQLDFDGSVDRIIGDMQFALREVADGEWNGVPIRDATKIGSNLEVSLTPVLEAAQAILRTVVDAKGWTPVLDVAYEDRDMVGGVSSIDLMGTSDKLIGAINEWMQFAATLPAESQPGLPLVVNHEARTSKTPELNRLSDVLTIQHKNGWCASKFVHQNDIPAAHKPSAPQPQPI